MVDHDDVDRLFARLERAPVPAELTTRVVAHTTGAVRRRARAVTWSWAAGGVALLLLVLAGYALGVSLADTTTLDLLSATIDDLALLAVVPGDTLAALGEVFPWPSLLLALLPAAFLVWVVDRLPLDQAPRGVGRTRVRAA